MPKTIVGTEAGKRHPLNMRTTQALRHALEAAANRAGRSLAQEVEVRLEHSLSREEHLIEVWGQDVFNIAESMAKSLWHIEREHGARWVDDPKVFELFTRTT